VITIKIIFRIENLEEEEIFSMSLTEALNTKLFYVIHFVIYFPSEKELL
jgi:hypothetical protein